MPPGLDSMASEDTIQIAAIFVESVLYGVYLISFFACLDTILFANPDGHWVKHLRKSHWLILVVTIVLFLSSTLNLALGVVRLIHAVQSQVNPTSFTQGFEDTWINLVKPPTTALQIQLANGILTFRCWVVYQKSMVAVAIPVLLWLAGLTCAIVMTVVKGTKLGHISSTSQTWWPLSFTIVGIALNIYATVMIVYKIWRVDSQSAATRTKSPRNTLRAAIRIIIESGLLQTIISFTVLITVVTQSDASFITSAAEIQIVGIAYNLILIRVSKEGRRSAVDTEQKSTTLHFAVNHSRFQESSPQDFSRESTTLKTSSGSASDDSIQGDQQSGKPMEKLVEELSH